MKEEQALEWAADTMFGKRFLELPTTVPLGEGPGQVVFPSFFHSICHKFLIFTRKQTIWSNRLIYASSQISQQSFNEISVIIFLDQNRFGLPYRNSPEILLCRTTANPDPLALLIV